MDEEQEGQTPGHYANALRVLQELQQQNTAQFAAIAKRFSSVSDLALSSQAEAITSALAGVEATTASYWKILAGSESPALQLARSFQIVDVPHFADALVPSMTFISELAQTSVFKELISTRFADQLAQVLRPTAELAARLHLEALSTAAFLGQATSASMARLLEPPNPITESLVGLGQTLTEHFRAIDQLELGVFALPSVISAGPSLEYFNAADLAASFVAKEPEHEILTTQREAFRLRLQPDPGDPLANRLTGLHPELPSLLAGARHALGSSGPDRTRHVCVSLRELTTHVLHHLAPDDAIRQWSIDPAHYKDGHPTRRARLLYIARVVNQPPFGRFIEKDVDALIEFIDLVHEGTHAVSANFSEPQLRLLLFRAEATLRFLLSVADLE